ncbi:uncharacterized protein LY79DRAFT_555889 [Colletotrichum navitas]|uniref:Uncharacterized protein n=1 Tax=Colletotrichum navitas TaxID=681940 RepID=A0AAD8V474_9PEZI|nr:uncharacterized protein LY79DRAFT_555889 [Colletotrichum navitas]KAK1590102.1 hypothetical protein LY79DRAFT_555889 [Colletotrichum navitas]
MTPLTRPVPLRTPSFFLTTAPLPSRNAQYVGHISWIHCQCNTGLKFQPFHRTPLSLGGQSPRHQRYRVGDDSNDMTQGTSHWPPTADRVRVCPAVQSLAPFSFSLANNEYCYSKGPSSPDSAPLLSPASDLRLLPGPKRDGRWPESLSLAVLPNLILGLRNGWDTESVYKPPATGRSDVVASPGPLKIMPPLAGNGEIALDHDSFEWRHKLNDNDPESFLLTDPGESSLLFRLLLPLFLHRGTVTKQLSLCLSNCPGETYATPWLGASIVEASRVDGGGPAAAAVLDFGSSGTNDIVVGLVGQGQFFRHQDTAWYTSRFGFMTMIHCLTGKPDETC